MKSVDITCRCFSQWGAEVCVIRMPKFMSLGCRSLRHSGAEVYVILHEVFSAIRKAISLQHELQVSSIVLIKPGSIPKTSSGKIQRYACRINFLNSSLNSIAHWPGQFPISHDIKSDSSLETISALV